MRVETPRYNDGIHVQSVLGYELSRLHTVRVYITIRTASLNSITNEKTALDAILRLMYTGLRLKMGT